MGIVIAVASGKGGTGKTTLTGGVASCLARRGRSILCVDLDVGLRNLDFALGMSDCALMDFSDVLDGRCELERAVAAHPEIRGLHLLTAPFSISAEPLAQKSFEAGFAAMLNEARECFDFILLDAPAGLGRMVRLAARFSDRVILVSHMDPAALRDASRVAGELSEAKQMHLVVNRVARRLLRRIHMTVDDAIDAAGLPLLGIVPEDMRVSEALSQMRPLALLSDKGAMAAYQNIAARLRGKQTPLMKL